MRLDLKAQQVEADVAEKKPPAADYTAAMSSYHTYLGTKRCECRAHFHAFRIHDDDIQREIIEALLLSGADCQDIDTAFGIPEAVMATYAEMFFDTSLFFSKLDVISYLEHLEEGFGKQLKVRAYSLGPDFVFFRFANIIPQTASQRSLVRRMFMASAYRAMEANHNGINSKVTKASVDHAKLMLKAFEALERFGEEVLSESQDMVRVLTKRDLELAAPGSDTILSADII